MFSRYSPKPNTKDIKTLSLHFSPFQVKSWHSGLSELQPFKFEENSNDQSNAEDKPTDTDDTKSSTPDETVADKKPRTPIKVPEISYDGTDAETTAALREELKNSLNRRPIKSATTSNQDTAAKTKDTSNTSESKAPSGSTDSTTKSSKKSRKSSKPGKTAKSKSNTDKAETSKDSKQEQKDQSVREGGCDKTIEVSASVGDGGEGNGVRKEDPADAVQTSQASCSMM